LPSVEDFSPRLASRFTHSTTVAAVSRRSDSSVGVGTHVTNPATRAV